MSKQKALKITAPIEDVIYDEAESCSSKSSSSEESTILKPVMKTAKVKPEKKPYVLTEARKLAFEKAKIARAENCAKRKILKEKELNDINKMKEAKKQKKNLKAEKKKQLELADTDSSSDEEPIIVKKKKSKKKVIYISDDEAGEKNIIIVNKIDSKRNNQPVPQTPVPKKRSFFL